MKTARIFFFSEDIKFALYQKLSYKRWVKYIIENEGKNFENLNFIFCSDNYLSNINRQYLKNENLTDVIAFNLNSNKENISGDIYISIERIHENAIEYDVSFNQELKRVIVHGLLHLLGYRDNTKAGKQKMKFKEDKYVADFTVVNK